MTSRCLAALAGAILDTAAATSCCIGDHRKASHPPPPSGHSQVGPAPESWIRTAPHTHLAQFFAPSPKIRTQTGKQKRIALHTKPIKPLDTTIHHDKKGLCMAPGVPNLLSSKAKRAHWSRTWFSQ